MLYINYSVRSSECLSHRAPPSVNTETHIRFSTETHIRFSTFTSAAVPFSRVSALNKPEEYSSCGGNVHNKNVSLLL